jgi:hypothetical protein
VRYVQRLHSEQSARITVAEARERFENPEVGERSPLESVTRGLVKKQLTEKT